MLFDDKKLNLESVEELIQCPIHSIEPYSLMLSPVYVLMKLNQKFVSVKAPLDFFTPEELKKLSVHETFYLPKFVQGSVRFQTAARLIKKIMNIHQDPLTAAPYEVSRESFYVLGTLWGKQLQIEPFFMAIFTDELCTPLNHEKMVEAREQTVVNHDQGLLLSGTFVFIALHLGWFDLNLLSQYRTMIYERTVQGEDWKNPKTELEQLVSDLSYIIQFNKHLSMDVLQHSTTEWTKKIHARLITLSAKTATFSHDSVSIYGEEGFAA